VTSDSENLWLHVDHISCIRIAKHAWSMFI